VSGELTAPDPGKHAWTVNDRTGKPVRVKVRVGDGRRLWASKRDVETHVAEQAGPLRQEELRAALRRRDDKERKDEPGLR